MLLKPEQEGRVRLPHTNKVDNIWNAGVVASMYLGCIAGIAITIIALPFNTLTKTLEDGTTLSTQQYEFWRLAVLALIAGTAGPATIRSAQNVLNAQKAVNEAEKDKDKAEDAKNKALKTAAQVTELSTQALENAKKTVSIEIDDRTQNLLQLFGKAKNQIPTGFVDAVKNVTPDSLDELRKVVAADASQNNAADADVVDALNAAKQDAVGVLDSAIEKIREASPVS